MERRIRVWLITLALLLVAALAAAVVFKLQLDDRNEELDAASAQRESAEAQLSELNAQLELANADRDSAQAQLEEASAQTVERDTAAQEEITRLGTELDAALARVDELEGALADAQQGAGDDMSAELTAAQAEIDELKAQLTAMEAELESERSAADELKTELAAANARVSELETRPSADDGPDSELTSANVRILELETELAAADARIAELETRLAGMSAELDNYMAVYAGDGVNHASADMENAVMVQADGITAAYALTNNTDSGNSVVFELTVDDEVLYTSGILTPGEALNEFSLSRVLDAGEYAGIAAIKTMAADGSLASAIRLPVKVIVAQ